MSAPSSISGLAINRFGENGIRINPGTAGTRIIRNHLGTDPTGMIDRGNGWRGVTIETGAGPAVIGGVDPTERNLISGNGIDGVLVWASNDNAILGNYIGTDVTGNSPLGNSYDGIKLGGGASANALGALRCRERDLGQR